MWAVELKKRNARGAILVYIARVEGNTIIYEWGHEGGKMQSQTIVCTEGKQKRTKEEQALMMAKTTIKNKRRAGYTSEINIDDETIYDSPLPMLAHNLDLEKMIPGSSVFVQPKLDGLRAVSNGKIGKLWSRKRVLYVGLTHIEDAIKQLDLGKDIWLDGELYRHGYGFQKITSIVRRTVDIDHEKAKTIQYHIYDICDPSLTFEERLVILSDIEKKIMSKSISCLVVVPTIPATTETILVHHDKFIRDGYEGTMVRLPSWKYDSRKRSNGLLKLKDFMQEEYIVVSMKKAEHEDTLGSVKCTNTDNTITFFATPSMTDEEKLDIWKHQNEYMGQVATVKFYDKTDGGKPRFPVLVGFRHENDI